MGDYSPGCYDSTFSNELECPVCFQEMRPPVHIWQCAQVVVYTYLHCTALETLSSFPQGHPVCEPCKARPEVRHCPTCRQRIVGRATLVEKIAAQVFSPDKDRATSMLESSLGLVDSSPETSPVSSPEPSFRPRLPTYFLSLRNGTRIGNEDFSLNSLREAGRGLEGYLASSPQRVVHVDSDSDIREFDFPGDSHAASFGFLD